ncbi:MAG: DUF87 domain-containing protein [Candidatus Melainabacteria bacterium]|nr:DUF87 domain-containing protein [Candidatus Melainabacteria bacterium]
MLNFIKRSLNPGARILQVSKSYGVDCAEYAATGERDAILASSGMGKSYLTGVLLEETLENKGLICVIDPEGEHFTLAERYPMLIVGGEHASVPFDPDAVDIYVEAMLGHGLSTIFDLSDFVDAEQQAYYALIADSLFQAEQKYRRKVRLVVEEAQIYAPQSGGAVGGDAKAKKSGPNNLMASQRIAKRGRKRAIDSLWATQRPASLNKDILSQCNRFWFGGITSELDYKAIRPFLQEAGISFTDIKSLQPGEFFLYGKGKTRRIQVRKRLCKHAGATPEAGLNFTAVSNSSLNSALGKLAEQVEKRAKQKQEEDTEIVRLKAQVRELEQKNRKLMQELEQERLATKVIERLGGNVPAGGLPGLEAGPSLPTARKRKSAKGLDDGTAAEATSDVSVSQQASPPKRFNLDLLDV